MIGKMAELLLTWRPEWSRLFVDEAGSWLLQFHSKLLEWDCIAEGFNHFKENRGDHFPVFFIGEINHR